MTAIRTGALTLTAAVAVVALAAPGPSASPPESRVDGPAFVTGGPDLEERAAHQPGRGPATTPGPDGTPLSPTDSTERQAALHGRSGVGDPDATIDEVVHIEQATTEDGYTLALGGAEAGDGRTVRFTVEVESETEADLAEVVAAVEDALFDPRSWGVDVRLVRTDHVADGDVRILVATPDTVDRLCGEAGMDTGGRYSCWTGRVAALNSWRFDHGAPDFDDLVSYRRYLINHEFGHALGHGHVDCPQAGEPAPVMMQQSISTGACSANGWPYPGS